MKGTITIELTAGHTADSGSGLPDLGHVAYWLKKEIPDLQFKDKSNKDHKIGDKFEVTRIDASVSN